MQAGRLNRRIRVERPVPVLDEVGNPTYDEAGQALVEWVLFKPLWSNILVKNGRQFMASTAETSTADASIRVRYRSDLTADMRVVQGAIVTEGAVDYSSAVFYEILAVLPDEADRDHVDLVCRTGANQG